jgi:hypothetical protein
MSANIDSNLSTTTPLASHGSAVWVQLYYKGEVEGEDELFGEPIKIKPIPEDVSDLKEKVIEKAKTMLGVQVYNLKVYAPKTTVPIPKGTESFDSGEEVPADTTSKKPLIVIAPKPEQQDGELRCCFCILESAFLYSKCRVVVRIALFMILSTNPSWY